MQRRDFIKAAVAAPLGLAASGSTWAATRQGTGHAVGLQLYTVMSDLEKDFEGTLAKVADIGYREVETIGAFGRDPHQVRKALDRAGLKSPSQHLMPRNMYHLFNDYVEHRIEADQIRKLWQETATLDGMPAMVAEGIEQARILGQKFVVMQIIWPEQMATRELMDKFCIAMNQAGDQCAKAGLVFSFHNHAVEFTPVNGYVPYDVILAQTDPQTVKLEMDLYWMTHAKADPLSYLARNPHRYKQFHLKDSTPSGDFATVGQGILNFPKLIQAGRKAGVEHFYVEYDRSDDPMKITREAFEYLRKII